MMLTTRAPTDAPLALLVCAVIISACSGSGNGETQAVENTSQTPVPLVSSPQPGDESTTDVLSDQVPGSDVTSEPELSPAPDPDADNLPSPPTSILTADNANAVIMQVFEVFTGRAYDKRLSAYPYVEQAPSLTPANNALGEHFYYETLACDNDGEKTESIYESGVGFDEFTFYDTTYVNCSIHGDVLTGRAVLSGDTCCSQGYQKEFSNEFSMTINDGEMRLSGVYRNDYNVSVENFNYNFVYSGGALSVTGATTSKTERLMEGSFEISPPITENQPITVTVTQPFQNDETHTSNLSYARGVMRIEASDSEIELDANNSDASTVVVTIKVDGESVTRVEPWSRWFHALSFVPPILGTDIIGAFPDGDGSVINSDSYPTVLTEVFRVITGERFGRRLLSLPNYPYPVFPYEEVSGLYGFGEEKIESCDNGGTVALRAFRWGYQQVTTGWRSEFDQCSKSGSTFNGGFSSRNYGNYVHFSQGLTVSTEEKSETFKGAFYYKLRPNRVDSFFPIYIYQLENGHFSSTDVNDSFVLSEANFSYHTQRVIPEENTVANASYSEMRGSFLLSNEATNQNTIKVAIPNPLHFDHRQGPEIVTAATADSGVLHIDAGNGNELYLNALTGDENTFDVFIYQPGQEPFIVVERWQDWEHLLGFNFNFEN